MIFVCVGSREYPFDRLIRGIDDLLYKGLIKEKVFMQIGTSNYLPRFAEFERFLNEDNFILKINQADTIICHGGEGVLVSSIRAKKRIITFPRRAEMGEHLDDHQFQICNALYKKKMIQCVLSDVETILDYLNIQFIPEKFELDSNMKNIISGFINSDNK